MFNTYVASRQVSPTTIDVCSDVFPELIPL